MHLVCFCASSASVKSRDEHGTSREHLMVMHLVCVLNALQIRFLCHIAVLIISVLFWFLSFLRSIGLNKCDTNKTSETVKLSGFFSEDLWRRKIIYFWHFVQTINFIQTHCIGDKQAIYCSHRIFNRPAVRACFILRKQPDSRWKGYCQTVVLIVQLSLSLSL